MTKKKLDLLGTLPFADYLQSHNPTAYNKILNSIKTKCYSPTARTKDKTLHNHINKLMHKFLTASRYWDDERGVHKLTKNRQHLVISDTKLHNSCGSYKNNDKRPNLWDNYSQALDFLFIQIKKGNSFDKSLSAYQFTDEGNTLIDEYTRHYLDNLHLHLLPVIANAIELDDTLAKTIQANITDVSDLLKFKDTMSDNDKKHWKNKADDFLAQLNNNSELKLDIPVDIDRMFYEVSNPTSQLTTRQCLHLVELMIFTMINMYKNTDDKFLLPHTFITKRFGRLYANTQPNLQACPKVIRHLCLSNFTDIDLDCAGITIMTDLVKQHYPDFTSEHIDYYIHNKSKIRKQLAIYVYQDVEKKNFKKLTEQEQEFHFKRMKTAFTSMTFGIKDGDGTYYTMLNNIRTIRTSGMVEAFNDDSTLNNPSKFSTGRCYVASLKKHPFFRNFRFELLLMFKLCGQLLAHQLNKQGKLELYPNCIFEKTKRVNRRQLTAYYNQTTERKILDEIIDFSGNNLLLPCHDGACLRNKPTELELTNLIKQIKLNVGVTVSFSIDNYVDGQLIDNSDL